MNYNLSAAIAGLGAVGVFCYGLIILHQPIFGIVTATGIVSTYIVWRKKKQNEALVLGSAWLLFALAAWTAQIVFMVPGGILVTFIIIYLGLYS